MWKVHCWWEITELIQFLFNSFMNDLLCKGKGWSKTVSLDSFLAAGIKFSDKKQLGEGKVYFSPQF